MTTTDSYPEPAEYEAAVGDITATVFSEHSTELNPENDTHADILNENYRLDPGDQALLFHPTKKNDILATIRETNEFDEALTGFLVYEDDSHLTDTDYRAIGKQFTDSEEAATREHAARLAYAAVRDTLLADPRTIR